MYIMTDIDDFELPVPDELVFNLKESKDLIINYLAQLERMFMNNKAQFAS